MEMIFTIITGILKGLIKLIITLLQIALEVIKILLLIFCGILRIFLSFLLVGARYMKGE